MQSAANMYSGTLDCEHSVRWFRALPMAHVKHDYWAAGLSPWKMRHSPHVIIRDANPFHIFNRLRGIAISGMNLVSSILNGEYSFVVAWLVIVSDYIIQARSESQQSQVGTTWCPWRWIRNPDSEIHDNGNLICNPSSASESAAAKLRKSAVRLHLAPAWKDLGKNRETPVLLTGHGAEISFFRSGNFHALPRVLPTSQTHIVDRV